MNRIAGVIVAAIGLVLAILSITRVLPGLTSTGVVLILFGGLIIGLSFIDKPDSEGTEKMSTPATFGNIFFAPTDVFRNLRRHPRWLAAVLIISAMSGIYLNLFTNRLTAERIANFAVDKALEMPFMNDDMKEQVEAGRANAIAQAKNPVTRVGQAVAGIAYSVFGFAFLAVIFMLFAMAMGGKINFWQAFSAAVYAWFPVAVIRFVLNTIILHLKDPADIHPVLGQGTLIQDNPNFLVTAAEHPVIYTLLGSVSLLMFYWLWLNATGLKNAGERVTGTTAWSAAIGVYVIMVLLSVAMAALFPGFIS
ncbi:MAG: YIP1 family protein [Pyrinomonadaceae bacterium]